MANDYYTGGVSNIPTSLDVPADVPELQDAYIPEAVLQEVRSYFFSTNKQQPRTLLEINNEAAVLMVENENSGQLKFITNKFILESLQKSRNEKVQILETFGEPHVSFFGERAKTYQGQGHLLEANSSSIVYPHKYRWASTFNKFYEEELRGTKLKENDNIALLYVGNDLLKGYFLNFILSNTAQNPNKRQFSFNMLVTEHRPIVSDDLDILYSVTQQLSISQKIRFQGLQSELETSRKAIDAIEAKIELSIMKEQRDNLEREKNKLRDQRDNILADIKSLFTVGINHNLEG